MAALRDLGRTLYAQGRYHEAREVFLRASARAAERGLAAPASANLTSAGACLYVSLNFRGALKDFEHARDIARSAGALTPLAAAENNLASLYIHMGEFDKALDTATTALNGPEGNANRGNHGTLLFQRADALAETDRFSEAEPVYREAVGVLTEVNDFDSAARILAKLGAEYLKQRRLDDAEEALSQALWLVEIHRLNASANVLSGLAQLKSLQGDRRAASALFDAAVSAPPNISPAWLIRSSRGSFRLANGDLTGALSDFQDARQAALEMRADIVPADQDRVALETGQLSSVLEGLVDAGNQLAGKTGDNGILRETFDAAEQDRMWSLRALVPSPNDWRSRLPDHYWEILAQYQALERTSAAGRPPASVRRIVDLRRELQAVEAASAGDFGGAAQASQSALAHVQSVLPDDSVLLSFLMTKTSAWVWAVDRRGAAVFPLPPPSRITADAAAFTSAVRAGNLQSSAAAETWRDLFGPLPAAYLNHSRWLIEPDGALSTIPFAALVDDSGKLALERAAIETIPGALLLERGGIAAGAPFLGIGDPIYNRADPRYRGAVKKAELTLPRLPGTAGELESCSRAWGGGIGSRLVTGADATEPQVVAALHGNAPIVHFATHVITAPGDFRSGLIALSLDSSGAMGLLGPREILSRPVSSSLVVMNGCHSAQGESLPTAGLMGLTRAWIGAGAQAVLATNWDVPDDAAMSIMTDFYRALRAAPARGAAFALRDAEQKAVQRGGAQWAAYSLLSRIP